MEIASARAGSGVEFRLRGRLDGSWAGALSDALEEAVRGGAHHLVLDLSEVPYVSSAGLSVLVRFHGQLEAIRGSLVVVRPSDFVRQVLELMGMDAFLMGEGTAPHRTVTRAIRRRAEDGAVWDEYETPAGPELACRLLGDPGAVLGGAGAVGSRRVRFPEASFGLGLGALGSGAEDCRDRHGEFLAAAGAAAYLPTDPDPAPDHVLAAGSLVPEVEVCYGLAATGSFRRLLRFEAPPEAPLALSALAAACLEGTAGRPAGFVLAAETTGLVGAGLRRSPAVAAAGGSIFEYPRVREWLSFTAERAYRRSVALAVGFVASGDPGRLAPFVRPLGPAGPLAGHVHAAAFSYRPLARGRIDLAATVRDLFSARTLLGVLHLLADRRADGAGESEFLRGAVWVGPIESIEVEATP